MVCAFEAYLVGCRVIRTLSLRVRVVRQMRPAGPAETNIWLAIPRIERVYYPGYR